MVCRNAGLAMPIAVSPRGALSLNQLEQLVVLKGQGIIAAQYIDSNCNPTELYPANRMAQRALLHKIWMKSCYYDATLNARSVL